MWRVGFFSPEAIAEVKALPRDMQSKFERIVAMIETHGLEKMRGPYVKHMEGKLWEMRLTGRHRSHPLRHRRRTPGCRTEDVREEDGKDAASRDRAGA